MIPNMYWKWSPSKACQQLYLSHTANQETGHTVNSVISIDGKYYLDLAPGKYNIIIAFPDGIRQAYNDVVIERGTASEMDFIY